MPAVMTKSPSLATTTADQIIVESPNSVLATGNKGGISKTEYCRDALNAREKLTRRHQQSDRSS
jgi:hypothetical protein